MCPHQRISDEQSRRMQGLDQIVTGRRDKPLLRTARLFCLMACRGQFGGAFADQSFEFFVAARQHPSRRLGIGDIGQRDQIVALPQRSACHLQGAARGIDLNFIKQQLTARDRIKPIGKMRTQSGVMRSGADQPEQ